MKVPNWKASGRQQQKGRKRHRRRQQKAKAFKALVKKLQAPRQLPGDFCMRKALPCQGVCLFCYVFASQPSLLSMCLGCRSTIALC